MFFCKYPATTQIYPYCHTLSLHDALPISAVAPSESLQIADRLLCEFRSLDRVLTQKPEALRRTLGGRDSVAALIFAARAASVEALRSSLMGRPITPTDPKLIAYLKTSMGSLPEELLPVLFLDGSCRLITDQQLQQGRLAQPIQRKSGR